MSRPPLSRRRFLTLPLALLLAPAALPWDRARAAPDSRRGTYAVDVGILYGMLGYHLEGTLSETVDRAAGSYEVKIAGEGDGIANRIESSGVLLNGRWAPQESHSFFSVKGRKSRSDIAYDWTRRTIAYHFRGETFFLRKLRVADDVVPVPEELHVDDSLSAMLNYADARWLPQEDGTYRTHVVRRKKADDEGPDDAQSAYRAELVPITLKVAFDAASGKRTALFDLTGFSSWARRDQPGRITFGYDKRPELLTLGMMLGTSVKVELRSPAPQPS
ncbi:MAG TPA: hypothetical protein VKG64_17525 [Methylomirabilota bacterium]|nr:hypothetical protein [Methylomirabilota bacterium]